MRADWCVTEEEYQDFAEATLKTGPRIPTAALRTGGAVLVDLGGVIQLLHRDGCAADHAEIESLVDAIFHIFTLYKVQDDCIQ